MSKSSWMQAWKVGEFCKKANVYKLLILAEIAGMVLAPNSRFKNRLKILNGYGTKSKTIAH